MSRLNIVIENNDREEAFNIAQAFGDKPEDRWADDPFAPNQNQIAARPADLSEHDQGDRGIYHGSRK